jgi:signal peptidase I
MSRDSRITRILLGLCWILGVPLVLAIVAFVGLRLTGLLIPYRTPGQDMNPTLRAGDQFFMEGASYRRRPPARGELIVFRTKGIPAMNTDTIYVKRLVGLPDDVIQIRRGALYVNGAKTTYLGPEHAMISYTNAGLLSNSLTEFRVPPNGYFVLGDNSAHSQDSRYWGVVPKENVRGRVWFRYWPWR